MHSRTRIGGGAVVAAVVILATGVIGRAQQSAPAPPRTRLGPVPAPTPRVAPAAVPKPVEQVAVKAQAIPPRRQGVLGLCRAATEAVRSSATPTAVLTKPRRGWDVGLRH